MEAARIDKLARKVWQVAVDVRTERTPVSVQLRQSLEDLESAARRAKQAVMDRGA